jgi:hypothetical protein
MPLPAVRPPSRRHPPLLRSGPNALEIQATKAAEITGISHNPVVIGHGVSLDRRRILKEFLCSIF